MKNRSLVSSLFCFVFLLLLSVAAFSQDMADNDDPGLHKTRVAFKHAIDAPKIYDFSFSIPVYQNEKFSTSLFTKSQEFHFASLPTNSVTSADDFYDQQYGLKMSYSEDLDNSWHLNSAYGSASDKPFTSENVSNLSVTLIRKHKIDPSSSWTFFLNYASNRSVLKNIPLPGLAYALTTDDRSQGWVLGFPFALYWSRPNEKVSTSFFILFPTTVRASIGYMIRPPFQLNIKLQHSAEMFTLANRREDDIRFYYETKKIALGLKTFLGAQNFFEIEAGKLFRRSIYDGKSPLNLTSDRTDLPDELQLMVSAQAAF